MADDVGVHAGKRPEPASRPIYSPTLPPATVALRVGTIDTEADEFRYYSTVTWKENAWGQCDMYMRRLGVFGYLPPRAALDGLKRWAFVDAINASHDILETYAITNDGLRYLRREWKIGLTRRRSYTP